MILKNKKKIRIIIGSLNVGGTENQLLKIINYLAKKNWEIELITLKEKGILAKYLNKKIKINNLNTRVSFKIIKFFEITFKLFKIFKKNPHTLTHFFLPQAYILGMISSCIANSKCKLIMSRRSLNFYQNKIIFCQTIEKFLHKKVNKILVNSKAIKKQLINEENVFKDKIKIIYNGIEVKNNKKFKNNNNFNYKFVLKTNYKRSYWLSNNKIRATIDIDINACSLSNFSKPIYLGDTVLEFKFHPIYEGYFRNFFSKRFHNLRSQKYSKYVRSLIELDNSGLIF